MARYDYSEVDRVILRVIDEGADWFGAIWEAAVRDYSVRLAAETRWCPVPRLVEHRLQSLRKRGLVAHERREWTLTTKGRAALRGEE